VADRVARSEGTWWFVDERSPTRRLHVSWHADQRIVVLSMWRDDRCIASFQLGIRDLTRLLHSLVTVSGDALARLPGPAGDDADRPGLLSRLRDRLARPWNPGDDEPIEAEIVTLYRDAD